MFILEHQDGDIRYELEHGGYAIEDSALYLSVRTRPIDPDVFPETYSFAVEGYPLVHGMLPQVIELSSNALDGPPNVHVYTTFHALAVQATLGIVVQDDPQMVVTLHVVSDDVDYYGEKAKPNAFKGSTDLREMAKSDLWIPL